MFLSTNITINIEITNVGMTNDFKVLKTPNCVMMSQKGREIYFDVLCLRLLSISKLYTLTLAAGVTGLEPTAPTLQVPL